MGDVREILLGYLDALWRRRWAGMLIAWVVCLGGWVAVSVLPNRYQAEARIYVDTDTLLAPLLQGIAVRPNVDQQIQIMQRTLLSRPNLEQVMRMTDMDLQAQNQTQRDAIIDTLQQNTRMMADSARNLFRLTNNDPDPRAAQRVVQSLLTIFVESQLGSKRRDMVQAQAFIDQQIKEYESALQAAEQRLADFRQRNMDVISGGTSFTQRLSTAEEERGKVALEVTEARIRRDNLKAQLEATPEMRELKGTAAAGASPEGALLSAQIREARRQLDSLMLRYTEQHPDVVAARRTIANLQAQARGGSGEGGVRQTVTQVPNLVYEQIRLRLVDEESKLQTSERRLEQASADITRMRGMAQRALDVEAQFSNLNRDYSVLKQNFEQLLSRREQARLAQAAEERTDTVQFRIIDPPRLPAEPSAPNRLLLFSGVLLAGLGAGGAFAFLLAQFDDSFPNVNRLRQAFNLPVLGTVSVLQTPAYFRNRVASAISFAAALIVLVGLYGMLMAVSSRLPLSLERFQLDRITQLLAEAR
jgi:polysaccharide chain length determinant protein (PEP-CTERM system associated)